ncbi:ribonuclease H-like domain-containing protein [Tanacetum coccineum]
MVAFLEKSTGSEGFHQVIDFLNRSHICYALTKKPDVYISFIKQFWRSAEATNDDNGEVQITATIDGHSKTITEASLRRHLKLDDHDSITSIPNSEIFEQLALMGYHTDSDKLTFQKGAFSPQWRFLIHTILHCLSPKKTAWEQFSSNIATAVICLATNRRYNFSRLIFEHMVSNISSPHKFLMYPRFIQICLDMQRKQLQQHSRTYLVPSLSIKVFNNMKRPTKGYSGQEVALFPTMLHVSEPFTSPSRITSSPSHSHEPSPSHSPDPSPSHSPAPSIDHSPDHTTAATSFPSPTQPTQPSPRAEYPVPTPNESPLHAVHSHGSAEGSLQLNELTILVTKLSERIGVLEDDLTKTKLTYSSTVTKLILRVKKLEAKVKAGTARKRAWVVLSKDDEDIEDDSSKQERIKLSDAEVQEKASNETEPIIQEVTPTEVIQDQGSSEKGNSEVSTAGATKGTASEVLVVSTAEENISTAGITVTYRRRSEEQRTRKDKGKAIMTEPEPKKKSKKELEQERMSLAEAIRLQERMDEEQRAQIAKDEGIARQWDEEERQKAMSEAKSSKKIDWNDPSVIRYHAQKMKPKTVAQARRNMVKYLKNQGNYKINDFKGMPYNEVRPIFEKVWDFNQHIEPMDHGSEKMKSPEKIEKEDVDTHKKMKEVSKESGAKRKKSIPRKSTRSSVKRQKMELDDEKEDLKGYLDIVPREVVAEDVESLSTKYPIMDWKTCVLTENFMYYQIFRGDGSSKNYKVLSEMLEDFDRQDGDLHTLFEPDEEDEIWKNQHEYNLISWRLCDFCGIHILLMQNGIAIHMLTEKKYPLSQEMLSKMLSKRLEVDHESTQAYELLKFIRSQVQEIDQGVGSTSGIRACALRNFDLEVMELENTQNNALAKLPMLKLGEYEMWEIRIKQYFQIQDYALWEVIENGNSWVPIPVTTPSETGTSTGTKMTMPSTIEEKTCKKNDVKARSLLLMALPNEHQLTFDQYVDAQSMFAAIKARFGGNEATKKTQKALLKQQYENFSASSSESLDSIFNRLQRLVSRLAILGVVTPPEDLNVKFLRSLPSEWDTHVVVWMNKPDFDTMGLDDLYNNFKIVEQKVKKSAGARNDDKNLAFVTTSGASSTNNINTVNPEVSTATTKVNTASTEISTATFSDSTVYAFLSTQPQGSQLVHEDLEQLHDDDLEEMDLKWNMALLSMRARKFYQRTGRKIIIDGSNTTGYDKSKVECFNCHKMGHFAKECRAPRSKDNRNWNQGGGALGANKASTHLGPLELVEAAYALEMEAIRDIDLVEEEASCLLGPVDVVGVSLNILISSSVRGYLTSLK